jgi:molecular chaperone GrpE
MPDREHEIPVKVVDRRWWAQNEASPETTPAGEELWRPGKPTYVEELERQLADKDRLLQETLSKYRDSAREFDEARARLRREVGREVERGRRAFVVELLEVLDNLDRALEAGRAAPDPATLAEGVDLVRQQFLARLGGAGVTRIDPLGEHFDPARHEAITSVPTDEPAQDGVICGVLAPGYLIGNEVLRAARVAVLKTA